MRSTRQGDPAEFIHRRRCPVPVVRVGRPGDRDTEHSIAVRVVRRRHGPHERRHTALLRTRLRQLLPDARDTRQWGPERHELYRVHDLPRCPHGARCRHSLDELDHGRCLSCLCTHTCTLQTTIYTPRHGHTGTRTVRQRRLGVTRKST